MNPELRAFLEHADVTRWCGLAAVGPAELGLEGAPRERGERGDPPAPARWCAGPPGCFEEGVRCWLDAAETVVVVEGCLPAADDGTPVPAPDLGEPAVRLDAMLDVVVLRRGELVYPDRGLAVRVNPENGLLLGLVGFAPTTADDYVRRLRPVQELARPVTSGRWRR